MCPFTRAAGGYSDRPEGGYPAPINVRLRITVQADAPPPLASPKVPRPIREKAEEEAALQWLKRTGRYAGLKTDLSYQWYMKFVGCLKQPCGRVEKQGSQQHNIEMTFPSLEEAKSA